MYLGINARHVIYWGLHEALLLYQIFYFLKQDLKDYTSVKFPLYHKITEIKGMNWYVNQWKTDV